ncbi:MAG TPA: M20/M25/M40 family metallo-hydrolase, partial [Thermoleophilia bacterium]|nr:M20/M25/M40 family metallo-hydrolase [Thermoleophilia bacterium]
AGVEQELGVDGIALLGPVLSGIAALDRELAARPAASYGRGSIHASTIEGGTQLPAYPSRCVLGIERCLIAGESVAQSQREIDDLLGAASAADERFTAEARLVVGREPVALSRDDPVVRALVQAATAQLGRAPVVRGDLGWADSGIFAEAGIPCAQFGPLGGGEHATGEWVDVESVKTVARVLEQAARAFCV